jgi:hypothetical protein
MVSYLPKNMRCMSPEAIDLVYTHTTLGCDATLRNATCNELAGQLTGFLGPARYSAYKRWGDTAAPKVCKEKFRAHCNWGRGTRVVEEVRNLP